MNNKRMIANMTLVSLALTSSLGYAGIVPPVNPPKSPGDAIAITRMLNSAFFPMDALFPTIAAQNSNQLNTINSTGLIASKWTQNTINTQLQTVPNTIARAY